MEGLATDDALDLDEQIIDKDFARRELPKWFSDYGNVRQMHATSLPPAGKAVECTEVPEGHWVKTLVVEPGAKDLVKAGVYQAYSVGISKPRIIHDTTAKGGRVVDGVFSEISLVDFPANPRCKFQIAKRAGTAVSDPIEIIEKVLEPQVVKVTPADVAKGQGVTVEVVKARAAAEWYGLFKRDMDPDVGGGVDRDKIPAEDFAGPNRTYPIVTPKDVHDAASLIGKADDPDAVKAKIISIAHRKGKEFVAELPDSWTKDDKAADPDLEKKGKPDPDCPTCHGTGKIRDGHVDCPDCVQGKTADADVTKGKRDCPGCGKSFDADHEGKFCSHCGHKLPGKTEKRKDAEPRLEDHPEPDGDEHGPDLDRDEGDKGDATPVRTKSAAPYHLARLHDATCAAFRADDVLGAHPVLSKGIGAAVDVQVFADAVSAALTEDAGSGSRISEIPALSEAYGLAVQLKAADPGLLEQALADVRKAFSDEYPDAHPKPTDIQPGQFKRPYLSAGRAPMTAGKSPRVPLASHVPDPKQFQRDALTSGQERQAPGSKAGVPDLVKDGYQPQPYHQDADEKVICPVCGKHDDTDAKFCDQCGTKLAGRDDVKVEKGRTYYTNAAKAQAQSVITAMHDYIVDEHPDVCPMHGFVQSNDVEPTTAAASLDTRATATPESVSAEQAGSVVTKSSSAPVVDEDLMKRLIREVMDERDGKIQERLDTLSKSVDEIAGQPDPNSAAVRGPAALQKFASQTLAGQGDEADAEQVQEITRLVKQARHPNTEVSVPALSKLIGQVGPENAAGLVAGR